MLSQVEKDGISSAVAGHSEAPWRGNETQAIAAIYYIIVDVDNIRDKKQ